MFLLQMKEIKFRQRDKIMDNMDYFTISDLSWLQQEIKWGIAIHPKYVMQYTWLKDKNWVEIYEGDLLEWRYTRSLPHEKITATDRWVYYSRWWRDYYSFQLWGLNEDCIVIGNIYQNPELLKS